MAHQVLTSGQEAVEAEALWQLIQAEAPRQLAPFDEAWFTKLRAQHVPKVSSDTPQEAGARRTSHDNGVSSLPQRPEAPLATSGGHASLALAQSSLGPFEPTNVLPSLPPQVVRHNLPRPLTSFVGRVAEIDTILRFLRSSDCRLVTVLGVGGAGKTRLAIEVGLKVASEQAEAYYGDGVFFVPLADVAALSNSDENSADSFATAIAIAMQFALAGAERPYLQVANYLAAQQLLLVLDNVEHLVNLAPTIVNLLHQAPGLTILVTSRTRLNVYGEQLVPLDGLPYPPIEDQALTPSYAALQLFKQTILRHAPWLTWSPNNLAAAAKICALVEGLPLALELAASMVRVISLEEIAAELKAGGADLYTTQRDVVERHRSLEAVFDHSWRLLIPEGQRVLGELSVFRGGFDRHAAQVVAGASLPSLALLIDHSLLREAESGSGSTRYSLHELVRQYAVERATSHRNVGYAAVYERHSAYYLAWVAGRLPDLRGERQQAAQAEIHGEIDNIRAAWRWAAERGDTSGLVAAGGALFHFYEMRSWFQEGAELFQLAASSCEQLVAAAPDARATRAWALLLTYQGWLTFHLGQQERARALLEHSLSLLDPLDAPGDMALTLNYLAAATYHIGDYNTAWRQAERALAASLRGENPHATAIAKTILGQVAYLTGAYSEARRWSLESLALEQTLGNRWGSVFTLICLGRVAIALKEYDDARRWFASGLAIRVALGDARGIGLCLSYLGDVAAAQGDYQEAERLYQSSLEHFRRIYNHVGEAMALSKQGAMALAQRGSRHARTLLQASLRTSWAIRAIPATLDALAGLATALADDEPARAAEIAALVAGHPAAMEYSRRQAILVQERLTAEQLPASVDDARRLLEPLVAQLLAESVA
jgi:predicted ATPase